MGCHIRGPMRTAASLLAVTLVAAVLRLTAPGHGLPADPEPDIYTVRHTERLREHGLGDRYLAGWKYPLLFGTVTATLPWATPEPAPDAPLEQHLEAAATSHRWTRYVVAAVSILAAPLTLLLALRFLGLGGATLAALFVATSTLHTWLSIQARPHAPTATLLVLSLLASARWIDRRRGRDALLAGAAAGIAGAALHSGLVAGLAFGTAAIWVLLKERARALPSSIAAGALALAAVVWAYGLEPHETRDWHQREANHLEASGIDSNHVAFGGHLMRSDLFNGAGFGILGDTFRSFDPVLGVVFVLGLVACAVALLRRSVRSRIDRAGLVVVAVAFIPFMAVFGLYELTYDRFFLPVFPLFALIAAAGLSALAERAKLPLPARALGAAALLALPLAASARVAWIVAQPTTHEQLQERVASLTADGGARTLLVDVQLFADWTPRSIIERVPPTTGNRWLLYQSRALERWGELPLGLNALPPGPDVPRFDGRPQSRAALEAYLAETDLDAIALATTWHSVTDPVEARVAKVEAWRGALAAAGWVLDSTVAPLDAADQAVRTEGQVPRIALPALFDRSCLGDRYEVYTRAR